VVWNQKWRFVTNDNNDRVEFIANAILKAVRELIDTGNEITLEALLARLEVYRQATHDDFMKEIYRDAIVIIRKGRI